MGLWVGKGDVGLWWRIESVKEKWRRKWRESAG